MVGGWEVKQKRKKHVGQHTRRSTRIVSLHEQEEAPTSLVAALLPEEHDPTLPRTSHTSISTTVVIPPLNNFQTLLPNLRGQEVEDEQVEYNLGSRRAWYDGRSNNCEGDSSDKEVCSTYMKEMWRTVSRGLLRSLPTASKMP